MICEKKANLVKILHGTVLCSIHCHVSFWFFGLIASLNFTSFQFRVHNINNFLSYTTSLTSKTGALCKSLKGPIPSVLVVLFTS